MVAKTCCKLGLNMLYFVLQELAELRAAVGLMGDISAEDIQNFAKIHGNLKPGQLEQLLRIQEQSPDLLEKTLSKLDNDKKSRKLSLEDLVKEGVLSKSDLEHIKSIAHEETEQILSSLHGQPEQMQTLAKLCREFPEQMAELDPKQLHAFAEMSSDGNSLIQKLLELSRQGKNALDELLRNKKISVEARNKIGELAKVLSPTEAAALAEYQKNLNKDDFEKLVDLCYTNTEQMRRILANPETTPEFIETLLDASSTVAPELLSPLLDQVCKMGVKKAEILLAQLPVESDEANSNSDTRKLALENFQSLLAASENLPNQSQKDKLIELQKTLSPEAFKKLMQFAERNPSKFKELISKEYINPDTLEKLLEKSDDLDSETLDQLLNIYSDVDEETFDNLLAAVEADPEAVKNLLATIGTTGLSPNNSNLLSENLSKILSGMSIMPEQQHAVQSGLSDGFFPNNGFQIDTSQPFSTMTSRVSEKYVEDSDMDDEIKSLLQVVSSHVTPKQFDSLLELQKKMNPEDFKSLLKLLLESPQDGAQLLSNLDYDSDEVKKVLGTVKSLSSDQRQQLLEDLAKCDEEKVQVLLEALDDINTENISKLVDLELESTLALPDLQKNLLASPIALENLSKLDPQSSDKLLQLNRESPALVEKVLEGGSVDAEQIERLLEMKNNLTPDQFAQFVNISEQFTPEEILDFVNLSEQAPDQFMSLVSPGAEDKRKSVSGTLSEIVAENVANRAQGLELDDQNSGNLVVFSQEATPKEMDKFLSLKAVLNDKPDDFTQLAAWAGEDPENFKMFLAADNLDAENIAHILELKDAVLPDEFRDMLKQYAGKEELEKNEPAKTIPESVAKVVQERLNENKSDLAPEFVTKLEQTCVNLPSRDAEKLLSLQKGLNLKEFEELIDLVSENPIKMSPFLNSSKCSAENTKRLVQASANLNAQETVSLLRMGENCAPEQIFDELKKLAKDTKASKLKQILKTADCCEPENSGNVMQLCSSLSLEQATQLGKLAETNPETVKTMLAKSSLDAKTLGHFLKLQPALEGEELNELAQISASTDPKTFDKILSSFEQNPEVFRALIEEKSEISKQMKDLLSLPKNGKPKPDMFLEKLGKLAEKVSGQIDTNEKTKQQIRCIVQEAPPECTNKLLTMQSELKKPDFEKLIEVCALESSILSSFGDDQKTFSLCAKETIKLFGDVKPNNVQQFAKLVSHLQPEEATSMMEKFAGLKSKKARGAATSNLNMCLEASTEMPLETSKTLSVLSCELEPVEYSELIECLKEEPKMAECLKQTTQGKKIEDLIHLKADLDISPKELSKVCDLFNYLDKNNFASLVEVCGQNSTEIQDIFNSKGYNLDQMVETFLDPGLKGNPFAIMKTLREKMGDIGTEKSTSKDDSLAEAMSKKVNEKLESKSDSLDPKTVQDIKTIATKVSPKDLDYLLDLENKTSPDIYTELVSLCVSNPSQLMSILKTHEEPQSFANDLIGLTNSLESGQQNNLMELGQQIGGESFEKLVECLKSEKDQQGLKSETESVENILSLTSLVSQPKKDILIYLYTKLDPEKFRKLVQVGQESEKNLFNCLQKGDSELDNLKQLIDLHDKLNSVEFETATELYSKLGKDAFKKLLAQYKLNPETVKEILASKEDNSEVLSQILGKNSKLTAAQLKKRLEEVAKGGEKDSTKPVDSLRGAVIDATEKITKEKGLTKKTADNLKEISSTFSPEIVDKIFEMKDSLATGKFDQFLEACKSNPEKMECYLRRTSCKPESVSDLMRLLDRSGSQNLAENVIEIVTKAENPKEFINLMNGKTSKLSQQEKKLLTSISAVEETQTLNDAIGLLSSCSTDEVAKITYNPITLKETCELVGSDKEKLKNMLELEQIEAEQLVKIAKENPGFSQKLLRKDWFEPEVIGEVVNLRKVLTPGQFDRLVKMAEEASSVEDFKEVLALREESPEDFRSLIITGPDDQALFGTDQPDKSSKDTFTELAAERLNQIATETGLEAGLSEDFTNLSCEATAGDLDKLCAMKDALGENKFAKLVNLSSVYSKEIAKILHCPKTNVDSIDDLLGVVDLLDGSALEKLMATVDKVDDPAKINQLIATFYTSDDDENKTPVLEIVESFLDIVDSTNTKHEANSITNSLAELSLESVANLLDMHQNEELDLAKACTVLKEPDTLENLINLETGVASKMVALSDQFKELGNKVLQDKNFTPEIVKSLIEAQGDLERNEFEILAKKLQGEPVTEIARILQLRHDAPKEFSKLLTFGNTPETHVSFTETTQQKLDGFAADSGVDPSKFDGIESFATPADLDKLTQLKENLDQETFQKFADLCQDFPEETAHILHGTEDTTPEFVEDLLHVLGGQNDHQKGSIMRAMGSCESQKLLQVISKLDPPQGIGSSRKEPKKNLAVALSDGLYVADSKKETAAALNALQKIGSSTIADLVSFATNNKLPLSKMISKFGNEKSLKTLQTVNPIDVTDMLKLHDQNETFARKVVENESVSNGIVQEVLRLQQSLPPSDFDEFMTSTQNMPAADMKYALALKNTSTQAKISANKFKDLSPDQIKALELLSDDGNRMEELAEMQQNNHELLLQMLALMKTMPEKDLEAFRELILENPELLQKILKLSESAPGGNLADLLDDLRVKNKMTTRDRKSETSKPKIARGIDKPDGKRTSSKGTQGMIQEEDLFFEDPRGDDRHQLESGPGGGLDLDGLAMQELERENEELKAELEQFKKSRSVVLRAGRDKEDSAKQVFKHLEVFIASIFF